VVTDWKRASDFIVPSDLGEPVRPSESRGKPTVGYFYPDRNARASCARTRPVSRLIPSLFFPTPATPIAAAATRVGPPTRSARLPRPGSCTRLAVAAPDLADAVGPISDVQSSSLIHRLRTALQKIPRVVIENRLDRLLRLSCLVHVRYVQSAGMRNPAHWPEPAPKAGFPRLGRRVTVLALAVGIAIEAAVLSAPHAGAAVSHRAAFPSATPPSAPEHPGPIALLIHPRLPGEGLWHPGSFVVGGSAPIQITTFRPDPANPGVVAYVAWIDHTRTRLALYPGYADPPVASPRGSGEIPSGERWRLLATFNGGFKWTSGLAGFLINGRADEPLVRGLGTVVAHPDGRVDIVRWHGPATLRTLTLARQNLPLIVDGGKPNPGIGDVSMWGATLGGGATVWRTSLGIDRHGNLLFAAADQQTPASLAALMIHIGAVRAVELDINPEWASFNGYAKRGGRNPIKLVPNPQQSAYRWLSPDSRDFFAVYTRAGSGALVPFH